MLPLVVPAAAPFVILLVNGWHRGVSLTVHAPPKVVSDMVLVRRPCRLVRLHRYVSGQLLEDKLRRALLWAWRHHI